MLVWDVSIDYQHSVSWAGHLGSDVRFFDHDAVWAAHQGLEVISGDIKYSRG